MKKIDTGGQNNKTNIAARSAIIEILSDCMGSLQRSTIQAESSKLSSFGRLTRLVRDFFRPFFQLN